MCCIGLVRLGPEMPCGRLQNTGNLETKSASILYDVVYGKTDFRNRGSNISDRNAPLVCQTHCGRFWNKEKLKNKLTGVLCLQTTTLCTGELTLELGL